MDARTNGRTDEGRNERKKERTSEPTNEHTSPPSKLTKRGIAIATTTVCVHTRERKNARALPFHDAATMNDEQEFVKRTRRLGKG